MPVTLLFGLILVGTTPGSTSITSSTQGYPDIKSCVVALEREAA